MTDAQLAATYIIQHPDADPRNNEALRTAVNAPGYEDRGLWGPYGGKGGTLSQPWLDEHKRMNEGGPSEISLMTLVPPADDEANENARLMAEEMAEELADRRATENMTPEQRSAYFSNKESNLAT